MSYSAKQQNYAQIHLLCLANLVESQNFTKKGTKWTLTLKFQHDLDLQWQNQCHRQMRNWPKYINRCLDGQIWMIFSWDMAFSLLRWIHWNLPSSKSKMADSRLTTKMPAGLKVDLRNSSHMWSSTFDIFQIEAPPWEIYDAEVGMFSHWNPC